MMKKIRFYFHLSIAFFQKQKKLVLVSFLVGGLSFFFFPQILRLLTVGQIQRIGLVGKFTTSDLPLEIQHLISNGLTEISPDGQITPSLAASWEIDKDGKEYIFKLKDNLFWQNGKPVLAKDINYNFSDVALTPLDDKRIKFELKEPFAPFPAVVSRPIFKKGLLGTGKYMVKSIKKNGQIVEKLSLGSLSYHFYPTEGAARTAFKLGEVDTLKEISNVGELATWKNIKISPEIKYNRFVAVFFNTQNPRLANKSVRQALSYAIENHWQPRALNPLNPRSWAYNAGVKPYEFDLANAKKLLKKSTETENKRHDEKEEKSLLTDIKLSTIPSLLPVAETIAKDWQQLKIKTDIKIITSLDEEFEALLISQEIPSDPDQYTLWHSTQATNISRLKNPKIDKLLEDGRRTLDQEKRKAIYFDFQRFLVEESPAIFLFHPTVYTISRKQ